MTYIAFDIMMMTVSPDFGYDQNSRRITIIASHMDHICRELSFGIEGRHSGRLR